MQITRRDAFLGATAAAVVTGATTTPLAIKAAGVKAALSGTSDARIVALAEEHDRVFAKMDKAGDRWYEAVMERMPPHLRGVNPMDLSYGIPRSEFWAAIAKACDCPEVEALKVGENRLTEKCHELTDRLSQTEAATLEGVCAKMRFAMRPGHCIVDQIIRSVAADLERLAGEAWS